MKLRIGLVGLPNVGKSSLFNALAQQSIAQAANYPFCTIEPNVARLPVPDDYLTDLAALDGRKAVAATLEWVDVAGLCRGAHRGEGLGNRFLGTVRECQAICHVLRLFDDTNTIHINDGKVDPLEDAQVVNLELLLADAEHVQRRLERTTCRDLERQTLERIQEGLLSGIPARDIGLSDQEEWAIRSMGLLTLKPVLYCFNIDEVDFLLAREETLATARDIAHAIPEHENKNHNHNSPPPLALTSAKFESELSQLSPEEKSELFDSLGVRPDGVEEWWSHMVLPRKIRELLHLDVVYTGPGVPMERSQTTKAHWMRRKVTADGFAARLHGDISRGFQRAQVIAAPTLLQYPSFTAAKDAGAVRGEGRDYELQGDDVVLVKWKEGAN